MSFRLHSCLLASSIFFSARRERIFVFLSIIFFNFSVKVSWVRHADVHIVAAGTYLYTGDDRFVPLHPRPEEGREEYSKWVLRLTYVQKRDEGIYECQISTKPIKALQYELHVVGE